MFSGLCHGTTAVITSPFRIFRQSVVEKQDRMANGQKCNIPLSGYGKGMSLGLWPRDIPMPYPPLGILRLAIQSALYICYNWMPNNKEVKMKDRF